MAGGWPTAVGRALGSAVVTAALALALVLVLVPGGAGGGARAALIRVGPPPAASAHAIRQGPLDRGTRLHVTVTLRPRDAAALATYARAVSTPGTAAYRRYLTPKQFARRFGAGRAQIRAVRSALRARGLRPGPASAGGLSISVSAPAGRLERAFSVSLTRLTLSGRRTAIASGSAPAMPASAASAVQSVLGLTTTGQRQPLLVRARRPTAGALLPRATAHALAANSVLPRATAHALAAYSVLPRATAQATAAGPQPCAAVQQASTSPQGQGGLTDNRLAAAYGFSGLYAAGDEGAGVTVAVYELESDDPADIAAYQACYGTHATVSYVPVDGGAGAGPGQGEAALDIENLIGFAPRVHVLVYQGPNSLSAGPGSGPYDVFSAIVNQDRARVVSVSWGQCEPQVGQAAASAENTLFEQATVQGQTIVAADGDSGAQDCDSPALPPNPEVAVDDPSSQPFVTGVGGTTLTALGPRPTEKVWNAAGTLVGPTIQPGASGGGMSAFWQMPPAQLDAAAGLGLRSAAAGGGSPCGGFCRLVPDVAADADPSTGYLVYWNGGGTQAGQPQGWQGIGGTSAAAPLWAALLALADASPACAGSPVGYADPALYRAAGAGYAADFNDVTTGDNDYTGTNFGRYAARPGYDATTGLGTPNAGALVPALCSETVRLTPPRPQRSTVHTRVSLHLSASDAAGTALTWGARGLPPGLKINAATGVISGRLSRQGHFTVLLSAHDSEQSGQAASLAWTVGAPPRISHLSLTSRPRGGDRLAFTVTAGRNAPALQTVAVTLPHGLRLTGSRRGVLVTSTARPPKRLAFTPRVARGSALTLKLRRSIKGLRITLSAPALRQAGGQVPAALRTGRRLALRIGVIDTAAGDTRLTARVAARR